MFRYVRQLTAVLFCAVLRFNYRREIRKSTYQFVYYYRIAVPNTVRSKNSFRNVQTDHFLVPRCV